jgi:putative copper resistance protein D
VEFTAPLIRLLLYGGAALAIGRGMLAVLAREASGASADPRAVRVSLWIAALALVMAPIALLLQQQQALELTIAEVPGLLRDTTWGRGWMPLAVSCLLSAILLPLPRTRARTRASSWALLLVALGVAVAMGGLGHAAADDQWPLASRVFDALHVVGVGAWIGGLLLMLLASAGTSAPTAGAWGAFSRMASVMAPVVLLSGVGSTWRRVGGSGPMAILASDYGKLLLLKIVLALAVMALGATQRRRIAAGETPSRTVVLREVVLAAVVLGATAWMTGTEPPGE